MDSKLRDISILFDTETKNIIRTKTKCDIEYSNDKLISNYYILCSGSPHQACGAFYAYLILIAAGICCIALGATDKESHLKNSEIKLELSVATLRSARRRGDQRIAGFN